MLDADKNGKASDQYSTPGGGGGGGEIICGVVDVTYPEIIITGGLAELFCVAGAFVGLYVELFSHLCFVVIYFAQITELENYIKRGCGVVCPEGIVERVRLTLTAEHGRYVTCGIIGIK